MAASITLPKGAVAAIGISCAIMGAIIFFAVLWAWIRFKSEPEPEDERESPRYIAMRHLLLETYGHLPPQLPTSLPKVTRSVLKHDFYDINRSIDSFAEFYFHKRPVPEGTFKYAAANALINGSRHMSLGIMPPHDANKCEIRYPKSWARVLEDPSTRYWALRAFIGKVVYAHISIRREHEESLLPREVMICYEEATKFHNVLQYGPLKIDLKAYDEWRALTGLIISQSYAQTYVNNYRPILKLYDSMMQILGPFRDESKSEAEFKDYLTRLILAKVATFGWRNFTAPRNVGMRVEFENKDGAYVVPGLRQGIQDTRYLRERDFHALCLDDWVVGQHDDCTDRFTEIVKHNSQAA